MLPIISIIIPVYNSGNYLKVQTESILAQSFRDFEVLLVDDGSTDTLTLKLLDDLASSDSRVKLYHQPNGGVGSARNHGILNAVGEFIVFADSDDYMFSDCLETMYNEIQGFDLLICSYLDGIRSELKNVDRIRQKSLGEVVSGKNLVAICDNNIISKIGYKNCVVWTQMFRRDVILYNKVFFQKIESEDELFSFEYLQYVNSVKKIDFQGVFYIHNENSLGSSHRSIAELDWIDKMERIYEKIFTRFKIKDDRFFHAVNWRIAIRYATFLLKAYYFDTRVPYKQRIERWNTVHEREWIQNRISLKKMPIVTASILFICKTKLYYLLDIFLVIGEWLHHHRFVG